MKMTDKKPNVKVRYTLKEGGRRIKVHGGGLEPEINPNPNVPNGYEFDLPLESDKGKTISLMPGSDKLTPACKIVLPSTVHYEFATEGKEKIGITHEGGKTTIKIPPGAPMWKLKLDKPGGALADNINKGSDDPVTVEEPEEGDPPDTELLSNLKKVMNNTVRLHEFLAEIQDEKLGNWERKNIIEQALVLIEGAYVHLPLKKAMHGVEPVQRLKLLMHRNSQFVDRAFHNQMISIFSELRDLHTIYSLPAAYKDKVAFLPFLIEEFYEGGKKKYMISKIFKADNTGEAEDVSFAEGVIITHWNGIPIEHAIALNGEKSAGSNDCARHARGLERMTIRPLKMTLPPDENWVDIDYLEKESNQPCNLRFKWVVADVPRRKGAVESEHGAARAALGVDIETEITLRVKKSLYYSENERIKKMDTLEYSGQLHWEWNDLIKDTYCEFSIVGERNPDSKKYGYFRIYSFNVNDPDYFVNLFTRKIKKYLSDVKGLIIDVRGNGGGLITAGERLLQVLTQKTVECERFQFINSPLMLQLCRENGNDNNGINLKKWEKSIERSIETGAVYSQGFPLVPGSTKIKEISGDDKYKGNVVLITDALCYSTTDIFAAGFQDNDIGKILGVHKKTGAGGANVWSHTLLGELLSGEEPIKTLPGGCEFTVAIRRSTRVGENAGMPLEDLGVEPDCIHEMTKDDLLYRNRDLIKHVVRVLEGDVECEDMNTLNDKD
jgi:hypothetical protein